MATTTASLEVPPQRKRINRFDSPWLNPRFIIGVLMIGSIIFAGLIGPFLWNTDLSLVGSSPLNLPPAWIQAPVSAVVAEIITEEAAAPTAVSTRQNSGLGGSSIVGLMATETAPEQEVTQAATNFSSLGGSSIIGLMATETVPAATPTKSSGLGGSSITGLMGTTTPAVGESAADATSNTPTGATFASKPGGTSAHPLGSDNSGRDILAALIVGAPASLRVGVIAATVGMTVGIIFGFAAGFLGGWVDAVIRTASDVAFTIPSLAVLLVISAYMRRVDLDTMALLLALFAWPAPTRLIRAQVLTLRERGYIRMAQLSGLSTFEVMFKEMLPNLLPYLAASLAGNISGAILAATSLEALGLGPTRYPTLGTTIFNALRATAIMRDMWWWWGFPLLILAFIFTGLFLIATGLDEIANPRLRGVKS